MKRVFVFFLVLAFLVAATPKEAFAENRGPKAIFIAAALAAIAIVGYLHKIVSGRNAEMVEKVVDRRAQVDEKKIEADVVKHTLDSNVVDGTIDYGRVKSKNGDMVSRLDVDEIKRSGSPAPRYDHEPPRYDYPGYLREPYR